MVIVSPQWFQSKWSFKVSFAAQGQQFFFTLHIQTSQVVFDLKKNPFDLFILEPWMFVHTTQMQVRTQYLIFLFEWTPSITCAESF